MRIMRDQCKISFVFFREPGWYVGRIKNQVVRGNLTFMCYSPLNLSVNTAKIDREDGHGA